MKQRLDFSCVDVSIRIKQNNYHCYLTFKFQNNNHFLFHSLSFFSSSVTSIFDVGSKRLVRGQRLQRVIAKRVPTVPLSPGMSL